MRYVLNSTIVSLVTTSLVIVVATFAAYSLARFKFRGREPFALSMLAGQMFPSVLLAIPIFVILSQIGLLDSFVGLVWWNWVPPLKAEARWPTIDGTQEMDVLDALVWDNAPSHRDAEITDFDLAFVGLPPYSPELNPSERLFEEIPADVQAFQEELDADTSRIRRLCGWDWINTAIASLPAPLANAA